MARAVLHVERPRVGLLNIGVEEIKGIEEVKQAHAWLKENELPIEYIGFIEGDLIGQGVADVIVVEGFAGNIALKTAEGTAKQMSAWIREALTSSLAAKLGLAVRALLEIDSKDDGGRAGGFGTFHDGASDFPDIGGIKLLPHRSAAGGHYILYRGGSDGGKHLQMVLDTGSTGHGNVSFRIERLQAADRANHNRTAPGGAKKTDRHIQLRGINQTTWTNLDLMAAYRLARNGRRGVSVEAQLLNVFNNQTQLSTDAQQFLDLQKTTAPPYFAPYVQPNPFFSLGNSFAPPRRLHLAAVVSF
jgi:hypothetical protein